MQVKGQGQPSSHEEAYGGGVSDQLGLVRRQGDGDGLGTRALEIKPGNKATPTVSNITTPAAESVSEEVMSSQFTER